MNFNILREVAKLCSFESGCKWNIEKVLNSHCVGKRFVSSTVQCPQQVLPQRTSYEKVYNVIPEPRNTASEKEKSEFNSYYPHVIRDLTEPYRSVPEIYKHYSNLLQSNLPGHKQASGLAVVTCYKAFESPEKLTPKNIQLANILGWSVDLLLCSWQINDDIMDGSDTRRGLPCWYKNVGLKAINDAVYIENAPYILLKKYFSGHHFHVVAMDWFKEVILKVSLGQAVDQMCLVDGKPQLNLFTMERFELLAKYKGCYPELMLPLILGMKLARPNDTELYKQMRSILIELGDYFEAQNDFLDCYADPTVSGKIGTDIQDGKCTWLIVQALRRATKSQKATINQHYGKQHPESVLEIKMLYEDLNLFDSFLEYEEESLCSVSRRLEQMPENFPREYFFKLLHTIYGRNAPKSIEQHLMLS